MRYFSTLICMLCAYYPLSTTAEGTVIPHPVVFELFTSQGCSSCPPADKIASKYADYAGILVLSYHVNYWDYLGWKDPYSTSENTDRQREYASAYLHSRVVYTPQAVIQGVFDVVGSDELALQGALSKASKNTIWVEAKLKITDGKLNVTLPVTSNVNANLLIVGYQKYASNAVPRGENSGTILTHRNSVTNIIPLGQWHGDALNMTKDRPSGDGVAVLIQSSDKGEIIGAGWL